MAQFARPDSDVVTGTWTATPLYDKIEETPYSDTDFISGPNKSSSTCEIGLSNVTDPSSSSSHIMRVRGYKFGTGDIQLTVQLYQGTTLIKSWVPTWTGDWAGYEYTLTTGEADSITDYTDLRVKFAQTYTTGAQGRSYVSWFEFEVPSGATSTSDNQPAFTKGGIVSNDNQSAYTRGGTGALDNQLAFTQGKLDALDSQPAYVEGTSPTQQASDNIFAYTKGRADITDFQNAYTQGKLDTLDNQSAYVKGKLDTLDNQPAYVKGLSTILDSINAFVQGSFSGISNINGYTKGSAIGIDNQSAYTLGSIFVNDNQSAYTEGFATGGDVSSSHAAFVIGIDNNLIPDSDFESQGDFGDWLNEVESPNNLYQSIDEIVANDNDYIWHTNPTQDDYYECTLSNPIGGVGSGDVVVFWRGRNKSGLGNIQALVQLKQGGTVIASMQQILTSVQTTYYFTLTPEEKANITDWNDLRIRIIIK